VQHISADGQPVLSNIAYLPFGPATTWTDGSGLTHTETYDNDYRPTGIAVGTIQDLGYLYDAADNITDWTDGLNAGNAQSFGYDAVDRLTNANGPYGAIDLGFDLVGNRLSKAVGTDLTNYTYAADSHRLQETTGADPGSYVYDAAGNLIQDDRFSYVYNQANRLAEVRQGGATIATDTYNAEGQRVAKTAGGQTRHFVYGPEGELTGVYDAATGTAIEEILYFGSVPVATVRGGNLHYIHTDHLGTPRLVTDQNRTVVWSWISDPFGEAAPNQDPDGDGTSFVLDLRFPGQYFDSETGRHYNYFRDYDPATGRYVQSDPIGLVGGLNTYLYANANPIRYADPEGLIAPAVGAAVVGYLRCLAECAVIEAAVGALVCPPSVADVAATCAVDCLNPLNWLPGSKVFKAGTKARQAQKAYEAKKAADRAKKAKTAKEAAEQAKNAKRGPKPNNGDAKKHGNDKHNNAIDERVNDLKKDPTVTNIRKNQQQVDVDGNKVGTNRPDIQYDKDGCHHCVEYDNVPRNSQGHGEQIGGNDPNTKVELNQL
jgi:RHS repeat-associated protein